MWIKIILKRVFRIFPSFLLLTSFFLLDLLDFIIGCVCILMIGIWRLFLAFYWLKWFILFHGLLIWHLLDLGLFPWHSFSFWFLRLWLDFSWKGFKLWLTAHSICVICFIISIKSSFFFLRRISEESIMCNWLKNLRSKSVKNRLKRY